MNASGAPPVSNLMLERFRLGELPPEEMRALEARMAGDADLRARFEALTRSDAEIDARYPANEVAGEIRRRLAQAPSGTAERRRTPWLWMAPLAAVALVVLAVWVPWRGREAGGDTVLVKGSGPSLVLYRRVGQGSERIESGAHARQGDQVRVGYRAAGRAYGAIVSVDRAGNVTRHLPMSGSQAAPLKADGAVMLDSSYELDAAPGWERFYFIAADTPFDLEPVTRALREAAGKGRVDAPPRLPLPKTLDQSVFTLAKDDRP